MKKLILGIIFLLFVFVQGFGSVNASSDYIYVGGAHSQIIKYNISNGLFDNINPSYGGTIRSIVLDKNYIYAGGQTTQTIRKYNTSDLSFVSESPSYGGTIFSIIIDGNYIYAGGQTTQTIRKYNKSNLSLVSESPSYGGTIQSIAVDGNYIYAGGAGTNQTIRKYNKSDLSLVSESPSYGGTIQSIAVDGNYIYAGGVGTNQKIKKYNKSDLSLVSESPSYGGTIFSIIVDGNYIYAGGAGTNQKIKKYNKSDLSLVSESPSYGGNIQSIAVDGNYIYAGGGGAVGKIEIYNKSDLSISSIHTMPMSYPGPFSLILGEPSIENGVCGTASKTYTSTETLFSGNFCSNGTQIGNPIFPSSGGSTSWTCQGSGGGTNKTCYASKAAPIFAPSNPIAYNPISTHNPNDSSSQILTSNGALMQSSTNSQAIKQGGGDPVTLSNGEFTYENTFMSIPGEKIPFEVTLNYKNQTYYNGAVGINWDHNYNMYLGEENGENMMFYNGKLGVFRFLKNGNGTYDYNPGLKANLVENSGVFEIHFDNENKYIFNAEKKISSLQDKYGNELNFTYSGTLLSQITDTLGRNYSYQYGNNDKINLIEDFAGNSVAFEYFDGITGSGSLGDLKKVIMTSGTETKTTQYTYTTGGDDVSNHNLVKLIDSKGQTYVENTYNDDRVIIQKYGNGNITYDYTLSGSLVTINSVIDREGNKVDFFYDTNGNNIQTKHFTENGEIDYFYEYNSLGYLTKEKKPRGNGVTYNYDSKGNLLEKRQKTDVDSANSTNDIVEIFTYNSRNQILTHSLPNGIVITNLYSSIGNLLSTTTSGVKKSNGSTYNIAQNFEYDNIGNLIYKSDGEGNETTFTYSGGLLTSQTSGTGSQAITQNFTYDSLGRLISSSDGKGNIKVVENTSFGHIKKITTPEGISQNFEYDPNNNKTKEFISQSGSTTIEKEYFYDVLDKVTKTTTKYNISNSKDEIATYDNNSRLITQKVGSGAKVEFEYNEFEKITKQTIIVNSNDSSKNIITLFSYDINGNLIQKTDPRGNITTYEYDLFDRLIKEIDGLGNYYTLTYNKDNTISEVKKYSLGNTLLAKIKTTYNNLGAIVKEEIAKDISGNIFISTTKDYDFNGNLISQTDTLGKTTTFQYDSFNRLTKTIDELENEITNTYDKNNNIISKTILQNNGKVTTTNYTYDKDNRLISETNQLGKTKTYTYNQLGEIINTTDEKGNITQYTYDYTGNILSKTSLSSSGNIVFIYTYDERGNNTSVTDGEGNVTTYVYNNINQLIQIKYPDNKEINYTYDKAGNVISTTDPNGTMVNYVYDALNRVTSKTIVPLNGVEGVNSENYSYDSLGRLISATDSNNHSLEFAYDSLNRLISESQSGSLVSYTYDDGNNLLSITNPNGKTTDYTYDGLNRVLGVSFSGTTFANYTYSGVLNDSLVYGNGKNISKTYDDLNRILNFNNGVKNYSYSYDDVSNIISDSFKNYTFDDFYRLSQVNESTSGTLLENFELDKAGNRVSDIGENEYGVNILNQYTSLSGSVNHSFVYDNNGNLISDGEKTFIYDYKNRLLKVQDNSGVIAEFAYDVLGRRYEKKTNSQTISYIYSDKNIISEYITVGENSFRKEYVNGIGLDDVIAVVQEESDISFEEIGELNFCNARVLTYSSSFIQYGWNSIIERCETLVGSGSEVVAHTYYFHKNHLGSIVGITDISGSVVSEYEYDSYGNFSLSGSDIGNTRLFTGREFDFEIGLYYNRARYYSSELGRFISRDPIGQVDDVNLYSYVANNPVMFNDLMGTDKKVVKGNAVSGFFITAFGVETVAAPDENWVPTEVEYTGYQEVLIFSAGLVGPNKGGTIKNLGKNVEKGIEKITKKYDNLECTACSKELEKFLKKEGIEYEKIILKGGWKDRIYSEKFGNFISENGYHEAIKIGDTVFDNINKTGIKYDDFLDDLSVGWPRGPKVFK